MPLLDYERNILEALLPLFILTTHRCGNKNRPPWLVFLLFILIHSQVFFAIFESFFMSRTILYK